jgi:lysophospholipase L1-like esterase
VQFARQGYVTATIDYRLGVEKPKGLSQYEEAMYRAQQDGKAAVRFFRKYAEQYGVDTSQIFITGSSAGSMACLAMAYMDESEVPPAIDRSKWGSLEGNSGNPGFSSKVQGVMNGWGALINQHWIQPGDVPLFNVSGTADKTVPYDSSYDWHGFKYGGYILYQRCLSLGIPTGWRPFYETGHTLNSNPLKQDSAIASMSAWLYTQLRYSGVGNSEGVRRWEKDINRFDSLNVAERNKSGSILFLGSSSVLLWKNIRTDLKYPNIINRGFGGSNLRDVAYYIQRIIEPHDPRAIFIYVGNDIVAGAKDKAPDQVLEMYRYVVQQIRLLRPNTPICWLAISPNEKRWSAWDRVQTANRLIEVYTKTEPNLYYLDASATFLGSDGLPNRSLFNNDKLHFNEAGYRVWGQALRKDVRRIAQAGAK